MVKIGDKIEDMEFEVYHEENIKKVKFSDYKGKWLVLLFYPADFTFVCPTELEEMAEMYEEFKPDLITLDITMPNKDGQQAMEEIITKYPDANVVMISAVRGDTMLECMSFGAKGYIEKPLKFKDAEFVEDFKSTIDEVFED